MSELSKLVIIVEINAQIVLEFSMCIILFASGVLGHRKNVFWFLILR